MILLALPPEGDVPYRDLLVEVSADAVYEAYHEKTQAEFHGDILLQFEDGLNPSITGQGNVKTKHEENQQGDGEPQVCVNGLSEWFRNTEGDSYSQILVQGG